MYSEVLIHLQSPTNGSTNTGRNIFTRVPKRIRSLNTCKEKSFTQESWKLPEMEVKLATKKQPSPTGCGRISKLCSIYIRTITRFSSTLHSNYADTDPRASVHACSVGRPEKMWQHICSILYVHYGNSVS